MTHKLEAELFSAEEDQAAKEQLVWSAFLARGRALVAQVEASDMTMQGLEQTMEEVKAELCAAEKNVARSMRAKEQIMTQLDSAKEEARRCEDALALAKKEVCFESTSCSFYFRVIILLVFIRRLKEAVTVDVMVLCQAWKES